MDENSIFLIIEINYENTKFKIEREEEITYNELREKSIEHFNIDIKNGDNIEFIYIDEDQEKNLLEHDDEDIFSAANYIDDCYKLNLDLIIVNNKQTNFENKINENKEEVNNNINNNKNSNNINQDKEEENKGIKRKDNEIGNKLSRIDFMFKKQFYIIQKDISKIINNKYKEIKNELIKLNIQVNNKNNNENIPNRIIERANKNQKENKSNKRNENRENNENKDENEETYFGRCSTFSNYIKDYNDFEIINNNKINNEINKKIKIDDNNINSDYSDIEHEEDIFFDKNDEMKSSNKKREKKFKKIRKNINSLYTNKNYLYNDIVNKGNNIFEIMNSKAYKIDIIDINNHIKKYLTNGHKKDLSLKEKVKYSNILGYLNHFLEIKKIHNFLDDNLKKEIEKEIRKEKDKQTGKENISENQFINLIDSFNKNNNRIFVQKMLQDLFKNKKENIIN